MLIKEIGEQENELEFQVAALSRSYSMLKDGDGMLHFDTSKQVENPVFQFLVMSMRYVTWKE